MDDLTTFQGFSPAAFDWFDAIAADNSRSGFEANRAAYDDAVRLPFAALLDECAAWSGGSARVFRQVRDLRFARYRDRPYWESVAGEIVPAGGGPSVRRADLAPDGLTASAGARRPFTPDQLRRFRAAVADDAVGDALAAIVGPLQERGATIHGATLRTVPRGFARDHPRAALLRHTALAAGCTLAPVRRRRRGRAISRDAALDYLAEAWEACEPLLGWLDAHVGAADAVVAAAAA